MQQSLSDFVIRAMFIYKIYNRELPHILACVCLLSYIVSKKNVWLTAVIVSCVCWSELLMAVDRYIKMVLSLLDLGKSQSTCLCQLTLNPPVVGICKRHLVMNVRSAYASL